jgi:pyridoxal 5'-phosphate synthase pdxS subunit
MKIDFIDESEVLSPADDHHLDKRQFKIPFVCGCRDLAEALRRISEGASMIRTKGDPGTGDVLQAVRHARKLYASIADLQTWSDAKVRDWSADIAADVEIVRKTRDLGRLPVVTFAAGGIATPADAALLMSLGMDGIFVGSGIFKSSDPPKMARSIAMAVSSYDNPDILVKISSGVGLAMVGTGQSQFRSV